MRSHNGARSLELWGGLEATVNRVGEQYFDQIAWSGHDRRLEDLEIFASLGISAIRYPVLWERTAPHGIESADWSWPDERLARLRDLGLKPIVGLLHHGSGPRDTSLLDPRFAEKLAAYAGAVAARYPWVTDYTPVNEPLTTARFSGLYGHWYPHCRDDLSFARALLNQCRGVVLAMKAIRAINPDARLIGTEDLGKTFSTPALQHQADYENERRWASYDLLTGGLIPERPMWDWLRHVGIDEAELAWFLENSCPPDILGFNYYLTSERFLDQASARYPPGIRTLARPNAYVDVEAVRVRPEGLAGAERLMLEAWDRYGRPMAITEVHNSSALDERLCWLYDIWTAVRNVRATGADLQAVTVWGLLGLYDWHNLVTRREGRYEPGVFDVRSGTPQPTALVGMVRDLARTGDHSHPALRELGWWRRPERLLYDGSAFADDRTEPVAMAAVQVTGRQPERQAFGAG